MSTPDFCDLIRDIAQKVSDCPSGSHLHYHASVSHGNATRRDTLCFDRAEVRLNLAPHCGQAPPHRDANVRKAAMTERIASIEFSQHKGRSCLMLKWRLSPQAVTTAVLETLYEDVGCKTGRANALQVKNLRVFAQVLSKWLQGDGAVTTRTDTASKTWRQSPLVEMTSSAIDIKFSSDPLRCEFTRDGIEAAAADVAAVKAYMAAVEAVDESSSDSDSSSSDSSSSDSDSDDSSSSDCSGDESALHQRGSKRSAPEESGSSAAAVGDDASSNSSSEPALKMSKPDTPKPDAPKRSVVKFFRESDPAYGFLSNFHVHSAGLTYDGEVYATAEVLYQALKYMQDPRNDTNLELAEAIRTQSSSYKAKILAGGGKANRRFKWQQALANQHADFVCAGAKFPDNWDEIRVDVMRAVVTLKFEQDDALAARLVDLEDCALVEASPYDSFWGEGRDGRGKNWLGKILEETRANFLAARDDE